MCIVWATYGRSSLGPRSLAPWTLVLVVVGPWSSNLDPWVLGPWSLVLGPWSSVLDPWFSVLGHWSVLGPWSLVVFVLLPTGLRCFTAVWSLVYCCLVLGFRSLLICSWFSVLGTWYSSHGPWSPAVFLTAVWSAFFLTAGRFCQ